MFLPHLQVCTASNFSKIDLEHSALNLNFYQHFWPHRLAAQTFSPTCMTHVGDSILLISDLVSIGDLISVRVWDVLRVLSDERILDGARTF